MTKKSNLVHGIGVNDANYNVTTYAFVGGRYKKLWQCPIYSVWVSMLRRCYSRSALIKNPTYKDCFVAAEWLHFMKFRSWMIAQDWDGKHLDKDILVAGNNVYSSATCVFVSGQLNKFLTDGAAARGEWPTGVDWHKKNGKFQARCCDPFSGKQQHIGQFASPEEAHEAWRAKKHEHACRYADMQGDTRIADALRSRYMQGGPYLCAGQQARPAN